MNLMELKNLNDVSIYILPLLDSNITLDDISSNSGFINAYTEDINRPYLEDKVFLLYDSKANTVESMNRFRKFKCLDTLYNIKYIQINKHPYTVYCFNNLSYKKDINSLISIGKTSTIDASTEILNFWKNVPVPELTSRLFYRNYRLGESIRAVLPEEDYYNYLDKYLSKQ